jgi:hypothetical protein
MLSSGSTVVAELSKSALRVFEAGDVEFRGLFLMEMARIVTRSWQGW